MSIEPRWRVGRKLGRTLYLDGACVGMVDSPELAANIVEVMNSDAATFRRKWLGAEAAAATANEALRHHRYGAPENTDALAGDGPPADGTNVAE